jgi:hypothetical protein
VSTAGENVKARCWQRHAAQARVGGLPAAAATTMASKGCELGAGARSLENWQDLGSGPFVTSVTRQAAAFFLLSPFFLL